MAILEKQGKVIFIAHHSSTQNLRIYRFRDLNVSGRTLSFMKMRSVELGVWRHRDIMLGSFCVTTPHAFPAVRLFVSLDVPFRVRFDGGPLRTVMAAIVEPNRVFAFEASEMPLMQVYAATHTKRARALVHIAHNWGETDPRVIEARRPELLRALGGSYDVDGADEWLTSLLEDKPCKACAPPVDWRIPRAFDETQPSTLVPSIHGLAASVRLSADHFSHLFREVMGVPYRNYALMLRVRQVLAVAPFTDSLTAAAHAAGFADLAHFTRTFRRMCGTTPSQFLRKTSVRVLND